MECSIFQYHCGGHVLPRWWPRQLRPAGCRSFLSGGGYNNYIETNAYDSFVAVARGTPSSRAPAIPSSSVVLAITLSRMRYSSSLAATTIISRPGRLILSLAAARTMPSRRRSFLPGGGYNNSIQTNADDSFLAGCLEFHPAGANCSVVVGGFGNYVQRNPPTPSSLAQQ